MKKKKSKNSNSSNKKTRHTKYTEPSKATRATRRNSIYVTNGRFSSIAKGEWIQPPSWGEPSTLVRELFPASKEKGRNEEEEEEENDDDDVTHPQASSKRKVKGGATKVTTKGRAKADTKAEWSKADE